MCTIKQNFLKFVLSWLLCLQVSRVSAMDLWQDADSLKDTVGQGFEWDEWSPAQLDGWKYLERFGAFYPWSDWIYHLDHGWLYPVGEDLGSLWLYSMKLNDNWIWTSRNHFDSFFIYKSGGFYFYDITSKGELYHDFQSGEWMLWYQLPEIFPKDYSWQFSAPPTEMVLIPQGQFQMGGVTMGETYSDRDNNGKYDEGEPFEDTNGNGAFDNRRGYEDEYPRHSVELSPFYIRQFEVTNQLWNQVVEWATARPDKPEEQRGNYRYEFDSLAYVDYAQFATAARKLVIADNNYQANPSERNKAAYDSKRAQWNNVRAAQIQKVQEILNYRVAHPSYPVNYVSWSDAVKWCNAYSEMTGLTPVYHVDRGLAGVYRSSEKGSSAKLENGYVKWHADGYRLPTEAEWEKAARGGLVGKEYPTGDSISRYQENVDTPFSEGGGPKNVGSYPPNPFGIYDIGGNLQEWCWDWKADYEEVRGSFTLEVPTREMKATLAIEDLGTIETISEIVNQLSDVVGSSVLAESILVSQDDSRLQFTLKDADSSDYLYVHGLDRNAIKILGLREKDSSLPLSIEAFQKPNGDWLAPARFDLELRTFSKENIQNYSVTAQAPEPDKVMTLFSITSQLNKGLKEAGLEGVIKAAIQGDRIILGLERGQDPAAFQLFIDAGNPMSTVIGFQDGQRTLDGRNPSTFFAWNQMRPSRVQRDIHGPVKGDRRVFRGAYWEFNAFHSRTSSRSSHHSFLPSKKITFRPVIGLRWDGR
jgi:formylglycine-generating enzyme required for sulfatase activity